MIGAAPNSISSTSTRRPDVPAGQAIDTAYRQVFQLRSRS